MHASTPENPFGVRDPRPEDEQFKGHLLATAAFAVTALACAVVGYKTGTEIIGYPAAAVSESIAVVNAKRAGGMAYKLSLETVAKFFKS
jgi:hypothetical protein